MYHHFYISHLEYNIFHFLHSNSVIRHNYINVKSILSNIIQRKSLFEHVDLKNYQLDFIRSYCILYHSYGRRL